MALSKDSCITLTDGYKIPIIALGTFSPEVLPKTTEDVKEKGVGTRKTSKETAYEATKLAIKIGYQHIDGAHLYGNEENIGLAIRDKIADGTVKREDLFYTGKLWLTFLKPEYVETALKKTLTALQLDYINLYIIHLPISLKFGENLTPVDENKRFIYDKADLCAVWKALEACKDAGLVKSIGVSNFNRRQLEMILNKPGLKYKPVCNQVECHPYLNQKKLLEFCNMHDIVLVAYGILGSINVDTDWRNLSASPVLHDPVIGKIGQKYNKSPAQVCIRYTIQRGIVAIIKSFTPKRIEENFQVFDFQLTEQDMKEIDGLNKNLRYWDFKPLADHPEYPFHDEY
ncbi:prostaglandin F synthase 1 [Microcaecilia unicolor]|uniref:Rho crystallin n=1 Tax=Microcaecilia unicolor TaxID=1415580 RepID=A0A6P7Z2V3_9AMPH|nr:prostaglandin F synthase 1-like [Microcaecilia unicolor]